MHDHRERFSSSLLLKLWDLIILLIFLDKYLVASMKGGKEGQMLGPHDHEAAEELFITSHFLSEI